MTAVLLVTLAGTTTLVVHRLALVGTAIRQALAGLVGTAIASTTLGMRTLSMLQRSQVKLNRVMVILSASTET